MILLSLLQSENRALQVSCSSKLILVVKVGVKLLVDLQISLHRSSDFTAIGKSLVYVVQVNSINYAS